MVYKRKRNVKIDNNKKYTICKPNTVEALCLEEYIPPSIDTGMEADEEKEIHLKRIIEGGVGHIPIPIMKEIDNPARNVYGQYKPRSRYITWCGDAKNEYILDDNDRKFCEDHGIDEEEFAKSINMISHGQAFESDIGSRYADVVVPKTLIRDENLCFPTYVCFRKRIVKPNRRSRRSEELSKEKVERMWTELHLLNVLCELSIQKNRLEQSLESLESDLLSSACMVVKNSNREHRKKLYRAIFRNPRSASGAAVAGSYGTISDLMFDRFRIRSLRNRLHEVKQKKALGERDAEVRALKKYNSAYKL